ncbi:winged helix-turn-helix domain-containing protein [Reichenbachiella sp. MALMAid0571]|uniref:winged helix-turn-helix domain-containing protein n=1 Tax=Reichenbachiella sp. MALMAid0571 TaxID=3143939 RepID=UPI0032DEB5A2
MKLKSLLIISLAIFTFLSWKFIDKADDIPKDLSNPHLEVSLRNIGHQVLLSAGDSSTRVLPIKKLDDHTFLIQFEKQFALEPDTLAGIVQINMSEEHFAQGYIVNVLSCFTKEVVYAFEIFEDKEQNLVPCLGRPLPKECYDIKITFPSKKITLVNYMPLMVSFMALAFSFFLLIKKEKKTEAVAISNEETSIGVILGQLEFFHGKQILKSGNETISLTAKENQVLKILASSPNETLSREQLQKEVWEDEGVLVGRSLDVFISKLRKKLEADPNLKIVNVHGKGYKLEI